MTKKGIKREAEEEPEDGPGAVVSSPPASARSSGGMSLRPGRRVKVREGFLLLCRSAKFHFIPQGLR